MRVSELIKVLQEIDGNAGGELEVVDESFTELLNVVLSGNEIEGDSVVLIFDD